MKKIILLGLMCLTALTMQAHRCAVLEFKAGVGISQSDVDGISAIFIQPAGYTMVERSQTDKAIEEQRFQRSSMTESQMVRIGQILNMSKIVVGDVNIVMEQYNVDARVINVETGTVSATEGATFAKGASYRATMQSLATKLAGKIAIRQGSATVSPSAPVMPTAKARNKVEVLYGYLKIFPNELGVFQAEPTSVIAQINKQAQHGYNNWRIPTNEELSLMRANNYLGGGEYMTRESKRGIVLLVSDGDDYQTVQEKERKAEEERIKAEQERAAELKAQGLVDLGLPSGTLWKDKNEGGGFYTYEQAINKFGDELPTKEQFEELKNKCQWTWTGNGYKVTGPNGNSISLPAAGYRSCSGSVNYVGSSGCYWSSSPGGSDHVWYLHFYSGGVNVYSAFPCYRYSVRLVQDWLVSDGDDYQTVQEKERKAEEERIKADQERRRAEIERQEAAKRRAAELKAQGFVDLGLPSGTLWKDKNERGGFYTYEHAKNKFGDELPTKEQFEELKNKCQWTWTGNGYKVTGPNGNSISLPAAGYRRCNGSESDVGSKGGYWSSTPGGRSDIAWGLYFSSGSVSMSLTRRCNGSSVRLVQERIRRTEIERQEAAKKRRAAELKAQGFVDLGLPSGTLWKDRNEGSGFYTYEQAINKFGDELPTFEQFEELKYKCQWTWTGNGYKVTGPNGNSISLPAAGYRRCNGSESDVGSYGFYWSSSPNGSDGAWNLYFYSAIVGLNYNYRCFGLSVRLVQDWLVSDGDDYQTVQEKERKAKEERIKAEQQERIRAEIERQEAAKKRRAAELKAQGFVDLGLPSGTLWRDRNEEGGFYTYEQAMNKFGDKLPTKEQLEELENKCSWSWTGNGYKVTGPNGNSIVLPAPGSLDCNGFVGNVGGGGKYWSSTPAGSDDAWYLNVEWYYGVYMSSTHRCSGCSVRLVQY